MDRNSPAEIPADANDKFVVIESSEYVSSLTPKRSRPVLSKYERARILALRAEQIGRGTPPLTDPLEGDGPSQIAEREFAAGKIPFIIRRYLPDQTFEDWRLENLGPCDRRLSHK